MPIKAPHFAGRTQKALFPVVGELADAGHTVLAFKILIFATRNDFVLLKQSRSRARYIRKLDRLDMEANLLELQTCIALKHDHPDF